MKAVAESGKNPVSKQNRWRMSRLARDVAAGPVPIDQILRRKRGQVKNIVVGEDDR